MARAFSIPTALRMVSYSLLRRFFEQLGLPDLDIDWGRLRKRNPKPIVDAIQTLAPGEVDTIEATLHIVFDLGCETGVAAIRESKASFDLPTTPDDDPDATPYDQAMLAWLDHKEVIERAVRIHQVDHLTWWRKRADLPRVEPDTSPDTLLRFGQQLSTLLLTEEGRGRVCTVERLSRRGTEYVFAHPDDFVQNVIAHDRDGELVSATFRQTFPIIFAINSVEGTLDTFAKLPPKLKPKVEALFARVLLGIELPRWQRRPPYRLDHLRDRSFVLATDPADEVRAEIRQMRLKYPNSQRQIILKADPQWPDDIWGLVTDALNLERVPLEWLELTLVTLAFEFHDGQEPRSVSLDVAFPSSCSVRSLPPSRVEIVRKYLSKWGIDVGRPTDPDLAAA